MADDHALTVATKRRYVGRREGEPAITLRVKEASDIGCKGLAKEEHVDKVEALPEWRRLSKRGI